MITPNWSWRDFVAGLAPPREDGLPRFHPAGVGATAEELDHLETALGLVLPADLRSLLAEMNGVEDEAAYLRLIMSVEETIRENDKAGEKEYAALCSRNEGLQKKYAARDAVALPFDQLFIFASRGNGDVFGFPIENNSVRDDRVFDWDHEMEEVTPFANSLHDFLTQWATMTARW